MTKVNDYNEIVMGTIDFQISYDKNNKPRLTIVQLINDVIDTLNTRYKVLNSENFDIYFHLDNIEDQVWFELNGLIHEAYNRRNKQVTPLSVIHSYLTDDELNRFTTLSKCISKEASPE